MSGSTRPVDPANPNKDLLVAIGLRAEVHLQGHILEVAGAWGTPKLCRSQATAPKSQISLAAARSPVLNPPSVLHP